jgi:hypothetical protein
MKRERIGRELEFFGDLPGRKALGSGPNKKPVDIEATVLGEGGQGRDSV